MQISSSTSLITSLKHYGNKNDLSKCFELARAAGFSAMDLSLPVYCGKNAPVLQDNYRDWAYEVRAAADKYGISINQTHGDALSGMEWDDPTCPRYEGFTLRNQRCIEISKILGAKWMVVHPTNLPHAKVYCAKAALEANLAYLDPLIDTAKKEGIGIAVENMVDFRGNKRRYCGGDPHELLELVDTINDSSVGICIDTGHAHQAGIDVAEFIRLAGTRVKATHIDDNCADVDSHLLPFYGTANWAAIARALKETGYDNDFAFELNFVDMPQSATLSWLKFIHDLGKSIIE